MNMGGIPGGTIGGRGGNDMMGNCYLCIYIVRGNLLGNPSDWKKLDGNPIQKALVTGHWDASNTN